MQVEKRFGLESPQTPLSFPAEWLLDIFNGGSTDAGIRVSELSALQTCAVLSCVGLISKTVAALPLHVCKVDFEKGREKRTKDHEHYLYRIFAKEPNPEMTAASFKRALMLHCLLWGAGFAEIKRDVRGDVSGIWPLNPARTRAVRSTVPIVVQNKPIDRLTLCFETSENPDRNDEGNEESKDGNRRLILAENILHMPGLSIDGRVGINVVQLCRQVIGLALGIEKYSAKFFGNGAVPVGLLSVPNGMEDIATEELRRQWHEMHGGEGAQGTAILSGGMTFEQIGVDADKSQLLEARKFQRSEVASIFQVPGYMIGDNEHHGSQKNQEQQGIEFLTFTIGPWLNLWEQEINRKLFLTARGQRREVKFDTRALRYPDSESRSKLYNGGKNWGYLCTNDIAEMEGHNPVEKPWAEQFWMPQGFCNADDPAAQVLGPKAKAALKAIGIDVPDAIPNAPKPDGVPGMSVPNGGRPEGVAENGRSALVVRADGKGYEQGIIVEERGEGATVAIPVDGLRHVVKDALLRFTTRKKPTVQKASDMFAGIAETVWNCTSADQRINVDFALYGHHVYARFKDFRGAITDDIARRELAETVKFVTGQPR